jgi:hypothetical protein
MPYVVLSLPRVQAWASQARAAALVFQQRMGSFRAFMNEA